MNIHHLVINNHLKKINPKYMTQMVDDEKKYIENKKFYLDESKKV